MKILILSSSSRHFPLDIQASLKEAGLESYRLDSLNQFIASPLRKEPFLAILEVGTTEDIDRALVAYEWAETVQPLAAARYLLLLGSRHISLQEKSNRFRGVEIAQLPLPIKNLMFKVELQLKVLSSESNKKAEKKISGFTAEIREVQKQRVMVIRGLGPREGGWKNSGEAPQGRTRWRWIDDPPKKGRPEENFAWSAESKAAPVFNSEIEAWEVKDPEADLQCHRDGKEIFSAKKSGMATKAQEAPLVAGPSLGTNSEPAPATTARPDKAEKLPPAEPSAPASTKNDFVASSPKTSPAASSPETRPQESPLDFSREVRGGANPLRSESKTASPEKSRNAETKEVEISSPLGSQAAPQNNHTNPGAERAAPRISNEPKAESSPKPRGEIKENIRPPFGHAAPAGLAPPAGLAATDKKTQPMAEPATPPAATKKETSAAPDSDAKNPAARKIGSAPAEANSARRPPAEKTARPDAALETGSAEKEAPPVSSTIWPTSPEKAGGASASPSKKTSPTATAVGNPKISSAPATEPSAKAAAKSDAAAAELATPPGEKPPMHAPPAEVIETNQARPADRGRDTINEFPEKTKEITGKIVIPNSPGESQHHNLLRASGAREGVEQNIVSSTARNKEVSRHLSARHYLTLTLEQLQDQNSTWLPVEGYRIYLSARHRYYGLREIEEVFPLWVYEGELPPEFLDLKKAWKFYDRPPESYSSLESLPAPLVRYLMEMKGARAEIETAETEPEKEIGQPAATSAKYFTVSGATGGIQQPPAPASNASAFARIFSAILKLFGLEG